MSQWPSSKAGRVFKALQKIGRFTVSQTGSHVKLRHRESRFADYIWAFHDGDEIGPRMLGRIAKRTGSRPEDL